MAEQVKNRMQLINWFISKYGYKRYLEIGCADDRNFNLIKCEEKVGVDPFQGGTVRMTSDDYFAFNHNELKDNRFDIVFIDGYHEFKQVLRDIRSSIQYLNEGGAIIIHDCDPKVKAEQMVPQPEGQGSWTGDVWKAIAVYRTQIDYDIATFDGDRGCAIILLRPTTTRLVRSGEVNRKTIFTWDFFLTNREEILRPMTFQQIKEWIGDYNEINSRSYS